MRERFSMTEDKAAQLKEAYLKDKGEALMVLSTCNRTEIYAFADCPRALMQLFAAQAGLDLMAAEQYLQIKKDRDAIEHLFRVGSGLESKILGDFEIIGQIKKAFQQAKDSGSANAFLDRLVNTTVQCSKQVKNHTELSTGATSVAFAAVLQIKKYLRNHALPKVLLIGTGKMGRTTCENLVNQTGIKDITLINRSGEKAIRLAERFGVKHQPYSELSYCLNEADVIIVATGANKATVKAEDFNRRQPRLLLDLSMPRNVEVPLYGTPGFEVIDVDHLSEVAEESIRQRQSEIPAAKRIIKHKVDEFFQWLETRRVAPTLQAIQRKMESWKQREIDSLSKKFPDLDPIQAEAFANQIFKRMTGQFARQLKSGDDLNRDLHAIQHIFELDK